MTHHDMLSDDALAMRIQLIRDYVTLQEKLVSEATSKLGSAATEYDFEDTLVPTTVIDHGSLWSVSAHGLGIVFKNTTTRILVDAHVGFMDAPNAFDAWRLVQYYESRFGTSESVESWQGTLDELERRGTIQRHARHDRHYVLKPGR